MTSYIALLRAINIGGHSLKMADLRQIFEGCGLSEVQTYIQTGNVVFASAKDRQQLVSELENALESALGYKVAVFLFTADELRAAEAANPFQPERLQAEQLCHLMFLSAEPGSDNVKALMNMQGQEYQFTVIGRVLYYAYAKRFAGNRRNINFEKVLGVIGTARSWKVIRRLIELAET